MSFISKLQTITSRGKHTFQKVQKNVYTRVSKNPFVYFVGLLSVLLLLIIVGNFLRTPKQTTTQPQVTTKKVAVYQAGLVPKIRFQAQVEKSGVVTITALTQGVVQSLKFKEGDHVSKGNVLVALSTNYQGGNVLSTQRAIAGKQYQNAKDTYDLQKETLEKQKKAGRKDRNTSI